MYTIFASPPNGVVMRFTAPSMDKAIRICISLYERGFAIRRVFLPTGIEVPAGKVEAAIRAGQAAKQRSA